RPRRVNLTYVCEPPELGRAAQHDVAILQIDRAAFAPGAQLLVDALSRRGDQVGKIALRQLEIDTRPTLVGSAVVLRQIEQHAGEPAGQVEQGELLESVAGASKLATQHFDH